MEKRKKIFVLAITAVVVLVMGSVLTTPAVAKDWTETGEVPSVVDWMDEPTATTNENIVPVILVILFFVAALGGIKLIDNFLKSQEKNQTKMERIENLLEQRQRQQ